jgi:hypothetical protein
MGSGQFPCHSETAPHKVEPNSSVRFRRAVQARGNRQIQPSPSAKRRRSAARITSCGTSRGSATMAFPAAFPAATATGYGLGRRRHRAPLVSGRRNLPATKAGIPQRQAARLQCAMPAAGRGVELEADCAPVGHYGGCGAAGVFQGRKRLPAMPKTSGRILAR